MITNRGWVVVDVETSGIDPATCRVLSIAALALNPDGTAIEHTLSTLINPGVDPGPTHVHGLTAETLHGAPQFREIAADLANLMRGRVLVAHNADFDHGFLAAEALRAHTDLPVDALLCTVDLARRLNPDVENFKLGTLAHHYQVPQSRPHDALDDATVLARVFRCMLNDAAHLRMPLPIQWAAFRDIPCVPNSADDPLGSTADQATAAAGFNGTPAILAA